MKKYILILLIPILLFIILSCSSKRKLISEQSKTETKVQKEIEIYEKNPNVLPERIERAIKLGKLRRDDRDLQRYVEAMYFVDRYERDTKIKEKEYARYLGSLMIIDEFERKYPEVKENGEPDNINE